MDTGEAAGGGSGSARSGKEATVSTAAAATTMSTIRSFVEAMSRPHISRAPKLRSDDSDPPGPPPATGVNRAVTRTFGARVIAPPSHASRCRGRSFAVRFSRRVRRGRAGCVDARLRRRYPAGGLGIHLPGDHAAELRHLQLPQPGGGGGGAGLLRSPARLYQP